MVDHREVISKDHALPLVFGRDRTIWTSNDDGAFEVGKLEDGEIAAQIFHIELRKVVLEQVGKCSMGEIRIESGRRGPNGREETALFLVTDISDVPLTLRSLVRKKPRAPERV